MKADHNTIEAVLESIYQPVVEPRLSYAEGAVFAKADDGYYGVAKIELADDPEPGEVVTALEEAVRRAVGAAAFPYSRMAEIER